MNVCVCKESLKLLIHLICASTWETAAKTAKQLIYLGLHRVTYVGFSSCWCQTKTCLHAIQPVFVSLEARRSQRAVSEL